MKKLNGLIQVDDSLFDLLDEETRQRLLLAVSAAEQQASFFQVGGEEHFTAAQWEEAILSFADGMLSGHLLQGKPKMSAEYFGWELDRDTERYTVWMREEEPGYIPEFPPAACITTRCEAADMERALLRFVMDDRIKMLVMIDQVGSELRLWKTEDPAVLGAG